MAEASEEKEEQVKEEIQAENIKNNNNKSEKPSSSARSSRNALAFWAYFTLFISILTLLFASLHSLLPKDDGTSSSWYLSLPADLRHHYSQGKLIKAYASPDRPPIQLFAVENGPRDAETVVLLHGLGCSSYSFRHLLRLLGSSGLRAVAVDLPGSGFSDGFVEDERRGGIFGWVWDIYRDVKEKGLFWGFDHLIETGYIPYEEVSSRVPVKDVQSSLYGSDEIGRVFGQVIDSLALAPVHLVVHDSAMGSAASWVSEASPGSVRSITIMDSSSDSAAFPAWMLGTPVLRELVLGSRKVFAGLLRLCCSRSIDESASEAYRALLKRKGGRSAVVESGKALNFTFNLGEWAGSEEVKGLPLQVLWSHMWSDLWIEEGRRIQREVPHAKFVPHFGGRWPQEGAAEEIAGTISEFVLSLPKSHRPIEEDPLPEHIKNMFDEAGSDHHLHHHHDHSHEHAAGNMDPYALNHGWAT